MTTIRWLAPTAGPAALPSPDDALDEPNGLLAAGGALEPDWLLASYAHGIFPWYEEGQPILWWSPDPRAVLYPERLHVSRSLRRTLRSGGIVVTADRDFAAVVEACAAPRRYTSSTWITPAMADAYVAMHELGWCHSFEAWHEGELVGGLYGMAIGRVFFGESMFTRLRDASKVAFVRAVGFLRAAGVRLIDCQLPSHHLARLGASEVPRAAFLRELRTLVRPASPSRPWSRAFAAWLERTAPG